MSTTKEYAPSAETRARILNVCKELFYEKGYKQTTYAEICRLADVHPGTITYHYGNKKNLASMLYNEVVASYNTAVETLFPEEDELQQVLISNGIHHKMLFNDPAFRRFSAEYSADALHKGQLSQYIDATSKAYQLTCHYTSEKKADFLFTAFKGMDAYLELYIIKNLDTLTHAEVFTYISEIYYSYLNRSELHSRLQRALEAIDSLEIHFENFRPLIVKKR